MVQPDDNMLHAHCLLGTHVYMQTLRIGATYYFSTVTMVGRTRLSVTLHVLRLSCYTLHTKFLPLAQ
jgi:hypothetical protein